MGFPRTPPPLPRPGADASAEQIAQWEWLAMVVFDSVKSLRELRRRQAADKSGRESGRLRGRPITLSVSSEIALELPHALPWEKGDRLWAPTVGLGSSLVPVHVQKGWSLTERDRVRAECVGVGYESRHVSPAGLSSAERLVYATLREDGIQIENALELARALVR